MKNKVTLPIVIVLSIIICLLIGDYVYKNSTTNEENEKAVLESTSVEEPEKHVSEETMESKSIDYSFEEATDTEDNPWGKTAGVFEMEELGNCILLTPNTNIVLQGMEQLESFSFEYIIHPWVRESSDGAGLLVWLMDEDDNIISEESLEISSTEEWKQVAYDLDNVAKIKILCNNGNNGDDSGDWVVIRTQNLNVAISNEFEDLPDVQEQNETDSLFEASRFMPKDASYEILDYNENRPVIEQGTTWDSVDALNPSVFRWNDKYYNYYSGWDGTTWRTGLALSDDGINWVKSEKNPILDVTTDGWDQNYIAANGCAIVLENRVYYYYHGVMTETGGASIGLAISNDGETFTERTKEPVLTVGETGAWDSVSVADPYVIEHNGLLYMYYCGQDSLGVQRLGVAISEDGRNWKKYNYPIMDVGVKGAFDEGGLGEPSVVYQYPYFYMLYTGRSAEEQRNIGVAISVDGVNWKKLNYQGIVDFNKNSWNDQVICDTTLLQLENGDVAVWYGGNVPSPDENLNGKIGYFTIKFDDLLNLTKFDANDEWEQSSLNSMDFMKGSHALEGGKPNRYVWVSDKLKVELDNSKDKNQIVVIGEVSLEMFQALGQDELTLTFWLNGEPQEEIVFTESKAFEIALDKPDIIKNDEKIELKIQASACVNPKQQGISADVRDLSWRLQKIEQQ